jgi:hypothetical protein
MLTTGAFIVRFANNYLCYKDQRNFVLCAIFIWDNGDVSRFTLFQVQGDDDDDDDDEVCCTSVT